MCLTWNGVFVTTNLTKSIGEWAGTTITMTHFQALIYNFMKTIGEVLFARLDIFFQQNERI